MYWKVVVRGTDPSGETVRLLSGLTGLDEAEVHSTLASGRSLTVSCGLAEREAQRLADRVSPDPGAEGLVLPDRGGGSREGDLYRVVLTGCRPGFRTRLRRRLQELSGEPPDRVSLRMTRMPLCLGRMVSAERAETIRSEVSAAGGVLRLERETEAPVPAGGAALFDGGGRTAERRAQGPAGNSPDGSFTPGEPPVIHPPPAPIHAPPGTSAGLPGPPPRFHPSRPAVAARARSAPFLAPPLPRRVELTAPPPRFRAAPPEPEMPRPPVPGGRKRAAPSGPAPPVVLLAQPPAPARRPVGEPPPALSPGHGREPAATGPPPVMEAGPEAPEVVPGEPGEAGREPPVAAAGSPRASGGGRPGAVASSGAPPVVRPGEPPASPRGAEPPELEAGPGRPPHFRDTEPPPVVETAPRETAPKPAGEHRSGPELVEPLREPPPPAHGEPPGVAVADLYMCRPAGVDVEPVTDALVEVLGLSREEARGLVLDCPSWLASVRERDRLAELMGLLEERGVTVGVGPEPGDALPVPGRCTGADFRSWLSTGRRV